MAGQMTGLGGCCCTDAGCAVTLNATAKCGSSGGAAISGATVTVTDGGGATVGSGTTNGSGLAAISLTVPLGTYTVSISQSGYYTNTGTATFTTCGSTVAVTVSLFKSSVTFDVLVQTGDQFPTACPLEDADVEITTSAGTFTGTTNGSGIVTVTVDCPNSGPSVTFNYDVTPPSGYGAAADSGSFSANPCTLTATTIGLQADTGYAQVSPYLGGGFPYGPVCGGRYLPNSLSYTDSNGSCTLTNPGNTNVWTGSYSFTCTNGVEQEDCGGGSTACIRGRTITVTTDVTLTVGNVYDSVLSCDASADLNHGFDVSGTLTRTECGGLANSGQRRVEAGGPCKSSRGGNSAQLNGLDCAGGSISWDFGTISTSVACSTSTSCTVTGTI
jgi:hypothetical protein